MLIFMIILWVIAAGIFITTIFFEQEAKDAWEKTLDRIDGKVFAKRQRRNDIKKKYGFDDSYDKYIA